MPARRYISRIIGATQCILGVISAALAYVFYSTPLQQELNMDNQEITLFTFILLVFAAFALLSGTILLREKI